MWIMIVPVLFAALVLLVVGYTRLVKLSQDDKLAEDEEQEAWCRAQKADRETCR